MGWALPTLEPPRLWPSACAACPFFMTSTCGTGVSTRDTTVYQQPSHVQVTSKVLEQLLLYLLLTPILETLVNTVPVFR